jgi:hypothetical protein
MSITSDFSVRNFRSRVESEIDWPGEDWLTAFSKNKVAIIRKVRRRLFNPILIMLMAFA